MALEKHISTPTAILLGSALIALAAYLGLRRAPAPAGAEPPSAPAAASTSAKAPAASTPAEGPASPAASRDEVARRALEAIEAHRARAVEECWKPFAARTDHPAVSSVRISFNITFDAQGQQLSRGVIDDRESRSDVGACFNRVVPPFQIAAPGATVYIEVPYELP